jgi:hypothetical protein
MARGRFISKEISLNEKVDKLSDDTARLLFTWLIPHLDCEGKMYGDPQIFRSIVAPRRNISLKKIEKYLEEFENCGLVIRYFVENNCYLFCENFKKHQPGLRKDKESQSQIPPFSPDLVQNKDRVTPELVGSRDKKSPSQVKVKVKDEVKVKVKGSKVVSVNDEDVILSGNSKKNTTDNQLTSDFNNFVKHLKPDYPDLDLDLERQKFETYNRENLKTITDPNTMFLRWLARAREFANENAKSRGSPAYQADDPTKFLTGKYQQFVER